MPRIPITMSEERHAAIKELALKTGDNKISYLINRLLDLEAARYDVDMPPANQPGGAHNVSPDDK